MINFFRKTRKQMADDNKPLKYFRYAIGEIILVVIGILIALSINNWNEKLKNQIKVKRYLSDLVQDLKKDSIALNILKNEFELAVNSKASLENFFKNPDSKRDSLVFHVNKQLKLSFDFIPNSVTINELKNSSNLDLISNVDLRREIVNLYNSYDELLIKLDLGLKKGQELIDIASQHLMDISRPTNQEVFKLMTNKYFTNKIKMNYLYSLNKVTSTAFKNCTDTMDSLTEELRRE
jgi:Family of unknown function (DUF6090)